MSRNKLNESIKYIANSLVRLSQDGNGNVIGVSSSRECDNAKRDICEKICREIKNKDIKVEFVDAEEGENLGESMTAKELVHLLQDKREKNDIVLVNVPSVAFVADGVEHAKICGRLVLLEKLMYSTYKDYEETLIRLKAHKVRIDGVVAYGA